MKRKLMLVFAVLAVAAWCLGGCGRGQEQEAAGGEESYTFTDDLGREVTVQSHERDRKSVV